MTTKASKVFFSDDVKVEPRTGEVFKAGADVSVKTARRKVLAAGTLLLVVWGLAACGGSNTPSMQSCPALPAPPPSSFGSIVDGLVANEMAAQGLVGMSVALLTNGAVTEDVPFFNVADQIIQGICTTSATAGSC